MVGFYQPLPIINPIQTRGGRILLARTLDVYNFFDKQAKATKLGTFPKIYLGTIWCGKYLSIKFDVTMVTTFRQAVFFQNFEFPSFQ